MSVFLVVCEPFVRWTIITGSADPSITWRVYLHTPWCRVLLEKLSCLQLVKKFPAFHGTPGFITALTTVRHLSLSWASPIQSIYPHPTSWRSILILSTHLRLGLPSGLLSSGFPTKTLYTPLSSPILVRLPCEIVTRRHPACCRGLNREYMKNLTSDPHFQFISNCRFSTKTVWVMQVGKSNKTPT